MKRFGILFLILICIFSMFGCNNAKNQEPSVLKAEVLEVYKESLLIKPLEDASEAEYADKIEIQLGDAHKTMTFLVGDTIQITYSGEILLSLPAKIPNVIKIEHIAAPVNIPTLKEAVHYTGHQLTNMLFEVSERDLFLKWGVPDGTLSGVRRYVWYIEKDSKSYTILACFTWSGPKGWTVNSVEFIDTVYEASDRYTYEGDGAGGDFIITLKSDGTMQYYEGQDVARIVIGDWTVDENKVICIKSDPVQTAEGTAFSRTNYFLFKNQKLIWIEKDSDGFEHVKLRDGEKFNKQKSN